MSIMFNEICINEEMLPIYIYIRKSVGNISKVKEQKTKLSFF